MTQPPQDTDDLVTAVKWLQCQGARDSDGRDWQEWVRWKSSDSTKKRGNARTRAEFDPGRHAPESLAAFISDVPRAKHQVKRVRQERIALENLAKTLGPSPLTTLIKQTRQHQKFRNSYGGLPTGGDGWINVPRQKEFVGDNAQSSTATIRPSEKDLLLGIDCEMVGTSTDSSALARICVCNAAGEMLLDRLVQPDSKPTDLRTQITGITAADLKSVTYTRADVQSDILKLVTSSTVIVGHTLSKDLMALRLEAPLVIDVGFLYGLEGFPGKTPSLANLVEVVLGRNSFRGEDGQAPHKCDEDTAASMELALHRMQEMTADSEPTLIWVPPPPPPPLSADSARTLFVHRIPDRPGIFSTLVAMFTAVCGAEELEHVDIHPPKVTHRGQNMRTATIVLRTAAGAEKAFLDLAIADGTVPGLDSDQRPQKAVSIRIPPDERTVQVSVRTMSANIGASCIPHLVKKVQQAVATPATKISTDRPKVWPGWKRAVDEELSTAGGSMPWKRLRATVVARYVQASKSDDISRKELGCLALAEIPADYLNREDEWVRLPA